MTLPVVNLARNGRSTRSFIREGLWDALLRQTNAGDFVVIEMGHNDDGDARMTDSNGNRATLPGIGDETITVTTDAGRETVHTFGWYLREMIDAVRAKSAVPIISGMVTRNYWSGNKLRSDWPFAVYADEVAQAEHVEYLNHTQYSVLAFQAMGPTQAKTFYPNDNTHTSGAGAELNARNFVQSIKCRCGGSHLAPYLNSDAKNINSPSCHERCSS